MEGEPICKYTLLVASFVNKTATQILKAIYKVAVIIQGVGSHDDGAGLDDAVADLFVWQNDTAVHEQLVVDGHVAAQHTDIVHAGPTTHGAAPTCQRGQSRACEGYK